MRRSASSSTARSGRTRASSIRSRRTGWGSRGPGWWGRRRGGCTTTGSAAGLMVQKAAWLYDQGKPCGAEANAAKYLGGEACFDACQQAVMTHGGFGYAAEYHVERYLREALGRGPAPLTPQLILCFIAERVLGLPKSY